MFVAGIAQNGAALITTQNLAIKGLQCSGAAIDGTIPYIKLGTTLLMNCGDVSVGDWIVDFGYSSLQPSDVAHSSNPIDTSKVTNPAPMAVYQTARYAANELDYTLLGFGLQSHYKVRLHFSESWDTGGFRVTTVKLNGVTLDSVNVIASVGANAAFIYECPIQPPKADTSFLIDFVSTGPDANALINGIEILRTS